MIKMKEKCNKLSYSLKQEGEYYKRKKMSDFPSRHVKLGKASLLCNGHSHGM